jgi:hypothetical protein
MMLTSLHYLRQRLLLLPLVSVSAGLPLVVTAVAFASHHAAVLRYLIPALLPLCAIVIWFRSRSAYFAFLLTVWFVIPLLRRVVDYSSGPLDPNPMLLAPYFTTLAVPLLRVRSVMKAPIAVIFPFVLCSVGVLLGLVTGLFTYPVTSVIHDLLNWITPVAFAAFLTIDDWAGYALSLQIWFPLLVIVSAFYTLAQFAFVFPWDIAWLLNLDAPSMGGTDAFALRAFGPLNSAGTAAFVLSAGTLFILNQRRWWRVPALAITILALLTTQVRAGWLVLAIGLVVSMYKNPRATGPAIAVLLFLGILISFLGLQRNAQSISDRFVSFEHPGDDNSANGRLEGYYAAWNDLINHPLGRGLGVPEDLFDIQGSFSLLDSAPIHILTTFGWVGGACYCFGLLLVLVPTLRAIVTSQDRMLLATAIPAVSLASIFFIGSITVALSGLLIWSFLPPSQVLAAKTGWEDPCRLVPPSPSLEGA